jgi:hypothetical protein
MAIEEVFLLRQLLEGLNDRALKLLGDHMQVFLDRVWSDLPKSEALQGFTWHRVIMSFAWRVIMIPKLHGVLAGNKVFRED